MRDLRRIPAALRPAAELLIQADGETTASLDALYTRRANIGPDPNDGRGLEARIARCQVRLLAISLALDLLEQPTIGLHLQDILIRRRRQRQELSLTEVSR